MTLTRWGDELAVCFPAAANHRILERGEEEALGRQLQDSMREIERLARGLPLTARFLTETWRRHQRQGGTAASFATNPRSAEALGAAMERIAVALTRVDAARREAERAPARRRLMRRLGDVDLRFERLEEALNHIGERAGDLRGARRRADRATRRRLVRDFGVPLRTLESELRALDLAVERRDAARSSFVLHNLRLVAKEANRYRKSGMSFEDLVQEGVIGLSRAAEKFDPERGYRFSTYAVWWVRQAVSRGFEKQGRTVRLPSHAHHRLRKIANAGARMRGVEGREPTAGELAAATGLAERDVETYLKQAHPVLSLDRCDDPAGVPLIDRVGRSVDFVSGPDQRRLERVISDALEHVPGREATIIRRRFGLDGEAPQSLAEVGASHGISREGVRKIEKRALARVREVLRDQGFALRSCELGEG